MTLTTYRFGEGVWHYIEFEGAPRKVEFLSRQALSAPHRLALQQALVNAGYSCTIHGTVRTYRKEV